MGGRRCGRGGGESANGEREQSGAAIEGKGTHRSHREGGRGVGGWWWWCVSAGSAAPPSRVAFACPPGGRGGG